MEYTVSKKKKKEEKKKKIPVLCSGPLRFDSTAQELPSSLCEGQRFVHIETCEI